MRAVYRILTTLLYPLLLGWLWLRAKRGKELRARLPERLGKSLRARPDGTLLWVHAASVGESISMLPLVQQLLHANATWQVLFTSGTVSSARLLESRLPARAFHQFLPLDVPHVARRFVRHFHPDAVLWAESDLWPNLLQEIQRKSIPALLVNARLSPKSFRRWQRFAPQIAQLMRCFDTVYAGSARDASWLHLLGISQAVYRGNLKYDAPALECDADHLAALQHGIGARPVWLAASTHAGEEEAVLAAHLRLRAKYPNVLTIIVPRHPQRGDAIEALIAQHDLQAARRSKAQQITAHTDIYLGDTIGELGLFYRCSPIAWIGGSFAAHGGHNPIEPAQLGCALLCGEHMYNFADMRDGLVQHHAMLQVADAETLAEAVALLFADASKRQQMVQCAQQWLESQRGVSSILVQHTQQLLQKAQVQHG